MIYMYLYIVYMYNKYTHAWYSFLSLVYGYVEEIFKSQLYETQEWKNAELKNAVKCLKM